MNQPSDAILGTPVQRFADRRARVLAALEEGIMVLPSASLQFQSGDTGRPYRPDSDLFYLSGCTEPESVAVLAPEAEDGPFILFVRPRDFATERWTGVRLGPEEARERFGADAVYPIGELEGRLESLLEAGRHAHYRLGASERTDAVIRSAMAFARGRGARKGTGLRILEDPGSILDEMRLRKDPDEIDRIRDAAADTVEGFRAGMRSARPGAGEWEVQAAIDAAFRSGGADGSAFETIVGSGANACVLHYVANDRRIQAGDLVLIDAGARRDMYCADITRTVPAGGSFTSAQQAVYEVVERARRAAVAMARVGSEASAPHAAAVREITTGLIGLGVLDGEVEALIQDEAYRPFFPHQTSHWLGLDVHDVGDYAITDRPIALEPGMVLTIEPGLYFHPELPGEDIPAELVGIGVRLEDDVLVTAEGPHVLTGDLPTAPDEVLGLMG
jgi:Xaa-Pro aminopeptidase